MTADYAAFLAGKKRVHYGNGPSIDPADIHPALFPFQADLVRWACRKGRAALFTMTGTGKTIMQVEWARLIGERTLILAPLAVTTQTIREAERLLGIEVVYARRQDEAGPGITITNYERLAGFDPAAFGAVVLDEAGILKNFSGATKKALVAAFRETTYRLVATATPAPNDIEELCNHADFLGIMTPQEMRSTFFIADSKGEFMRYRLKGHSREAFYRWLSSWSMALRRPSDLGYSDDGFILPPLSIAPTFIPTDWAPNGALFPVGLKGIAERSEVRRATLEARVAATADLITSSPGEIWLIWCGLNDEGRALARLVPDAVVVEGSDHPDRKAELLLAFADGEIPVLITKPSIAGFGLNFQRCARMAFLGLGDSYEQYFQAIRRCWRFGQTRPVVCHIVLSDAEKPIYDNVIAKEAAAEAMLSGLLLEVKELERAEIFAGSSAADSYEPTRELSVPPWMATV